MMYKRIYYIWTRSKYGPGVQPVKGNTIKQARKRFKKRFPRLPITGANWIKKGKPITEPI